MPRPRGVMHPVTLTATKGPDGQVAFDADSHIWDSSGKFVFHKGAHDMHKHDYHLVEFVLDDRTGDRLKFPSAPHDAMWVEKVEDPANPQCPRQASDSDYAVIEPICVCDHGKRLIVRNQNPDEQDWSFTLNFEKGDGPAEDHVQWDPIIQNQNHGRI